MHLLCNCFHFEVSIRILSHHRRRTIYRRRSRWTRPCPGRVMWFRATAKDYERAFFCPTLSSLLNDPFRPDTLLPHSSLAIVVYNPSSDERFIFTFPPYFLPSASAYRPFRSPTAITPSSTAILSTSHPAFIRSLQLS